MNDERTPPGRPPAAGAEGDDATYRVDDRRHWQRENGESEPASEPRPARPTIMDEYRQRAEDAERQLQEYIEAFKRHKEEHEEFRARLARDVERRVELRFGELLGDLLGVADDLDLVLDHVTGVAGVDVLAKGVGMARDRFLTSLERMGVERIAPDGQPFDPNEAEALRLDPVPSKDLDGSVTVTLHPGYRLGQRVVRPARVAVGRWTPPGRG